MNIIGQDFKIFISKILLRSNISPKTLELFTTPQKMNLFKQAFTDRSYSLTFNYELLEIKGDVYVNLIAANYVRNRFPRVISLDWLSRIKIILQSKITLPKIAEKLDFQKYIYTSGIISREKKVQILEDVVEAFFGAIVVIGGENKGAAYAVSYEILSSLYDEIDITLDVSLVIDLKNRVKEIFDSQHWGEVAYQTSQQQNRFITKIYKQDKETKKKELVIEGNPSNTRESSMEKAMEQAIEKFKSLEKPRNPYIQKPKKDAIELKKPAEIPKNFGEWWKNMLLYSGIVEPMTDQFLEKKYLQVIRNSLVSDSYAYTFNNSLYKFEGDAAIDIILVEFILEKEGKAGVKHEAIFSKIRHSITKGPVFSDFAKKFGLIEFSKLRETPDDKDYDILTRAFIGGFISVIDSVCGLGVGYEMAYRLLTKYFMEISLKTDPSVIFDPVTDLKEIYTKRGWTFDSHGTKTMDHIISEDGSHVIKLYDGNKNLLAIGAGKTKQEAKIDAVTKGLKTLRLEKLRGHHQPTKK